MKTLTFTILLFLSFNSLASVVVPRKCNPEDLNVLTVARNLEFPTLNQLLKDEVIPNIKKCTVFNPVNMFPTVCGQIITKEYFFTIETEKGNEVRVTTENSYRSCYRFDRTYLQLKEISIKPIKK